MNKRQQYLFDAGFVTGQVLANAVHHDTSPERYMEVWKDRYETIWKDGATQHGLITKREDVPYYEQGIYAGYASKKMEVK